MGRDKKIVLDTKIVSVASDGSLGNTSSNIINAGMTDWLPPSISEDGRYVVFDHLTNGEYMKIEKMNGLEIMEAIIR